jgi:hypothetical protein
METSKRDQLIGDYVDRVLDNMSTKDLMRIVGEQLNDNLSTQTKNLSARLKITTLSS